MFNFLKKWMPGKDEVSKPGQTARQAIAMLRREYDGKPLTKKNTDPNPVRQFSVWFDETLKKVKDDPNAMILSTSGADGHPSSRTVLLKGFDDRGFLFFTNYKGRKARQIAENPNVSISFYWPGLMRQVHIEGVAEKVSEQESDNYFKLRPLSAKISAWVSVQSREIESRDALKAEWDKTEVRFKDEADVPRPPHWGGYRIKPNRFEFWQGRLNRLHDRICYRLTDGKWDRIRLSP